MKHPLEKKVPLPEPPVRDSIRLDAFTTYSQDFRGHQPEAVASAGNTPGLA